MYPVLAGTVIGFALVLIAFPPLVNEYLLPYVSYILAVPAVVAL